MAAAYDSAAMLQQLKMIEGQDNPSGEIWDAFSRGNFEEAAKVFLGFAWQPENLRPQAYMRLGHRYPRYQMERMFARFFARLDPAQGR